MKDISTQINEIIKEYLNNNKKTAYVKLKKISKAIPENEKLKYNLAYMEQDQGMIKEAKKNYLFLIKKFNNFNSKINLYNILLKEKNYLQSLEIINNILIIKSELINVWLDKAYILFKLKKFNESIEICLSILNQVKNSTIALNLLGLCFMNKKKYKDSEKYISKGLIIDKNNVPLLNSFAKLKYEIWELEEAEKKFLKALEIKPDSYQTLNNLGGFYLETNNSNKAEEYYLKALALVADEPTILNNLSKTYLSLNREDLAKKYCKKSLKIRPLESTKKTLSLVYFKEQNYLKAWEYFDGRLGLDEFILRNDSYALIKEKLLKNKKIDPKKNLLIIREQGVGDEILYGTMYKNVLEKFDKVIIEADERLISLFINSFGKKYRNNFVKLGYFSNDPKKLEKIDQVLYAGSLGRYFRRDLDSFPKENYLKIDQHFIQETKNKLSSFKNQFKVGISWKSINNIYAKQKSLSLKELNNLLNFPNIDFFNLQYGDVNNEIEKFNKENNSKIINFKNVDLFNDFNKIASILKNLDLFVTISNSTAHLAGALGIKTILIKPFNQATFHYWNQNSFKTPWYSSIEIIGAELIKNKKLLYEKIFSKMN